MAALTTPKTRVHLIPNAHLDPVWLWDWREGMNEGIQTCQTILDLMDEDPELTFIRGESSIYEHIEREAPKVFDRIRKQVEAGRWDVVGGTYVQPDTNLPATETFCRHYEEGTRYFKQKFGVDVTVAWAADSFGHAAGLPTIMANAGIKYFAFTRPFPKQFSLPLPVFWWQGPNGAKILSYRPAAGWYGSDRDETERRLNAVLDNAVTFNLRNVACFIGLGNHGGGTTRRMLKEVRAWAAAHPEVEIVFSGLHRFFGDLHKEIDSRSDLDLPVHQGELGFTLRGCYSSTARFKFAYRKAESQLIHAEQLSTLASDFSKQPPADLSGAWKTLLFNTFHDVLPGSSIERAMDEQLGQLGGVIHAARDGELRAINQIASQIKMPRTPTPDDSPEPVRFLVVNNSAKPFAGPAEFETCMDYRPILPHSPDASQLRVVLRDDQGTTIPSQAIGTEHTAMRNIQWRRRIVANLELAPFEYRVYTLGIDAAGVYPTGLPPAADSIESGNLRVRAIAGSDVVEITRGGKPLFGGGIRLITIEDPYGSWGAMDDTAESYVLTRVRHRWTVDQAIVLESGPVRQTIWVRLRGGQSRADLRISLAKDRDAVDVFTRVMWDERSARLKLAFNGCGDSATFDVPGATIARGDGCGEVPGGRWAFGEGKNGSAGFASDALYNFDLVEGDFRVTVARASRYADDAVLTPDKEPYTPATDVGELKFNFLLSTDANALPVLAEHADSPLVVQAVPMSEGSAPARGTLASLEPASVDLLSLRRQADGSVLARLRELAGKPADVRLRVGSIESKATLSGHSIVDLNTISPGR